MTKLKTKPAVDAGKVDLQLKEQRRTVDFDTFDFSLKELLSKLQEGEVRVAPVYQRKFRWDPERASKLIESILLGIPIPSLFMATNSDNTWEVVDGVQRLTTIAWFAGEKELRERLNLGEALTLTELQKLSDFNGSKYEDLPPSIQLHLRTRPLKVITLNDKSDKILRYDLFERLNTGGVALTAQEIRNCIFQGDFSTKLEELSKTKDFKKVVKLTSQQQKDGTAEECVLRFFAFLDRYKQFDHAVTEFLNDYMGEADKDFDYVKKEPIFHETFAELAKIFPHGLSRPGPRNTTSLIFYEGISVGAALALQKEERLSRKDLKTWLASPVLHKFTTGATNSLPAVKGRIEFCRDHFLGKTYVHPSKD